MDYGVLGAYFDGAVAKTLAGVDIMGANKSHQHEFNGVGPLRALFGDDDIKGMRTTFAYLDDGADPIFDHGYTTWYDARRKHPTRTEYRLYYMIMLPWAWPVRATSWFWPYTKPRRS